MAEVITSKNNDTVKFLASLSEKGTREHTGSFVMEGKRSVYEAVEAKVATQIVVSQAYTRTKDYSAVSKWHLPVTVLSDAMFQRVSETKTPQGILAVCKIRKYDLQAVLKEEDSILLLEDVRDPGNMGTIIRIADWFGINNIFASKNTVDVFNPKVVQATMGALARVRIHYVDLPQWLAERIRRRESEVSSPIYGTLLDGRNMYEEGAISNKAQGIIIMGNEGNGISEEVRRFITHPLYIPSYKQSEGEVVESLNVSIATAIILAEFRR